MKTVNKPEATSAQTVLTRQKKIILILAAAALVLGIVYLCLNLFAGGYELRLPLCDEVGDVLEYRVTAADGSAVTREAGEGEIIFKGEKPLSYVSAPYLYPEIALDELESVTVTSPDGTYTLRRDENTGTYVFLGAEKMLYKAELVSSLKVQSCVLLAQSRLDETYETEEALAPFGLDEQSSPLAVTVTEIDGTVHRILIGCKIVSEDMYYAKDADRPYVYVIPTDADIYFYGRNDFFTPLLAKSLTQSECQYMEAFSVRKNGELFFDSVLIPEEQRTGTGRADMHRLTYPAEYAVSLTTYYDALLCLENPTGSSVVETDVSSYPEEERAAIFTLYGLDAPTNEVSYTCGGVTYSFITGASFADGNGQTVYYAYAPYTDAIVTLPLDAVPFLACDRMDFINPNLFQINIENVEEVTVTTPERTADYLLSGSGKDLAVTETLSGLAVDTGSFRQLYMALLSVKAEGYSDTQAKEGAREELSFTVKTKFGETFSYTFTLLATTRDAVTFNGVSEFYVNRACVTDVSDKFSRLARGEILQADY